MNFQSNNPPALNSNSASSWHIPPSGHPANGSYKMVFFFSIRINTYINCCFLATGSSNNQPIPNPLSMQFCTNGRLNENTLKRIPLPQKPQNIVKPALPQQQTTPTIPSPVTSTNPKTPSPLTNDVRLTQNVITFLSDIHRSKKN